MFDQTCTASEGSLLWKKPLFSQQSNIKIQESKLVLASSIHQRLFHHQYDMSCCGEKELVANLNEGRKFHDIKAQKYV